MTWEPWGLLGLLAIPAILVIHLFRRRFPVHPVAGLFLWPEPTRDPSSGRRREKLRRSRSLFLELLLAALLTFILLDLRRPTARDVEHLVVVLDTSASMTARDANHDTLEAARERMRGLTSTLRRNAAVTIVTTERPPVVLAGPAATVSEARARIAGFTARRIGRGHDPLAAFELAREISGSDATLHWITDRDDEEFSAAGSVHLHAVGQARPNTALLAVRRERRSDKGQDQEQERDAGGDDNVDRIFLRLRHFGNDRASVTVDVTRTSDDTSLAREVVALSPDGETRIAFDVAAGDADLRITIPTDALAVDNEAILVRPAPRRVRCRIGRTSPGVRTFLERTLGVIDTAVVIAHKTDETPDNNRPVDILFTGPLAATGATESTWWCRIGAFAPPTDTDPVSDTTTTPSGDDRRHPVIVDRSHPLTRNFYPDGLRWPARTSRVDLGFPLASRGSTTLIGETRRGEAIDIAVNVDFDASDLVDRPAGVTLVHDIILLRRAALPGSSAADIGLDERCDLRVADPRAGRLTLHAPTGSPRPLTSSRRLVLTGFDQAGVHEVRQDGKTDDGNDRSTGGASSTVLHRFGVHFRDAAESDLRGASSADRPPEDGDRLVRAAVGEPLVDPWIHFPCFGLVLAILLTHFRITQRDRSA